MKQDMVAKRYLLTQKLGEGGMGVIYLAEDLLKGGMQVAIKIISSSVWNKDEQLALKYFRKEYEIMRRFYHPNLVKVYDYGHDYATNSYFIVMEYIPGTTLKLFLKDNQPSQTMILDIFVQILRALEFIHTRSVIYRDLKPDNIMIYFIDGLPYVKLLDFGLADYKHDVEAHVKGTVSYIAPEVLKGVITVQSDIFSAGVLFYEMLTGKLIYSDNSARSIISRLSNLQTYQPDIFLELVEDDRLRLLLSSLLAYSLDDRFKSCSGVLSAINKVLNCNYELETAETMMAYITRIDFAGRRELLAEIKKDLSAKNGGLFILRGISGVGKSRLAEEIGQFCQLDEYVFIESRLKYSDFNLENITVFFEELIYLLSDELIVKYGSVLKKLLPEYDFLQKSTELPEMDEKSLTAYLLQKSAEIIGCFNQELHTKKSKGLILFCDDLHLADENFVRFLENLLFFSIDGSDRLPLILGTVRSDYTAAEELTEFFSVQKINDRLNFYNLSPFTEPEVENYLENVIGHEAARTHHKKVEMLLLASGGIALFLKEIIELSIKKGVLKKQFDGWYFHFEKKSDRFELSEQMNSWINENLALYINDPVQAKVLNIIALTDDFGWQLNTYLKIIKALTGESELKFINELISHEILEERNGNLHFKSDVLRNSIKNSADEQVLTDSLELVISTVIQEWKFDFNNLNLQPFELIEFMAEAICRYSIKGIDHTQKVLVLRYICSKLVADYRIKKVLHLLEKLIEITADNNLPGNENRDVYIKSCAMLGKSLHSIGKTDEAISCLQRAENQFDQTVEVKGKVAVYFEMIIIYVMKRDNATANRYLDLCQPLIESANDREMLVETYLFRSEIAVNEANFDLGMTYLNQGMELIEDADKSLVYPRILFHKGNIHYFKSEFAQAEDIYNQIYQYGLKTNNRYFLINAAMNAGIVSRFNHQNRAAAEWYGCAKKYAEELGDKKSLAGISGSMGSVFFEMGNLEKALHYYQQQYRIEKEIKSDKISTAVFNIGLTYGVLGRFENGIGYMKKYIREVSANNNRYMAAMALTNLADIYVLAQQDQPAVETYQQSIDLSRELGLKQNLLESEVGLGQHYLRLGSYEEAADCLVECKNGLVDFPDPVIQFKTDILEAGLLALSDVKKSVELLENLQQQTEDVERMALIWFTLWEITGKVEYIKQAGKLYKMLFKSTPKYDYQQKLNRIKAAAEQLK